MITPGQHLTTSNHTDHDDSPGMLTQILDGAATVELPVTHIKNTESPHEDEQERSVISFGCNRSPLPTPGPSNRRPFRARHTPYSYHRSASPHSEPIPKTERKKSLRNGTSKNSQ